MASEKTPQLFNDSQLLELQDSYDSDPVYSSEDAFHLVRAFAHGAMGDRIDPSWGGPIELFLVPASAP